MTTMSILRFGEVRKRTGLSRVTIWRLERDGAFPARVSLGGAAVGWREDEVQEWIDSRPRVNPRAVEKAAA